MLLRRHSDAGGDEREAKKLRKEFTSDVQRAKSELGVSDKPSGMRIFCVA